MKLEDWRKLQIEAEQRRQKFREEWHQILVDALRRELDLRTPSDLGKGPKRKA